MGVFAGPDLKEDGLVLALDAANPKNYNLTAVEVLVVGGGAGGAADVGGGGGAGGLIYNSNFAVNPGIALTVTVGAGGTGRAPFDTSAGGSGGNSVFGSLTATGGGGGGNYPSGSGTTGGSGGGGSRYGSGGAGTSGEGFAGGSGTGGAYQSGGGGGAGGVGGDGNSSTLTGGNGGIGLEFPQFASVGGSPAGWFAGGGGGGGGNDSGSDGRGFGGLGGGGTGAARSGTYNSNASFRDAVANTGGGGGGTGGWNTAGNGGSGIVIVRYPGPQKAIGGTVTSVGGYTIHTFTTVGSTTFTPLVATNNSAILGLADFSGRNNFGTSGASTAAPTYNSSFSGALTFDSGDIVTVPMSGLRPTSAITQEVWVYITNNTPQVFIGAQYGTGSNNSYALWLDSANNWTAGVNIGGSLNYQSHNATITTSTWYHFVHTYDGSNQRLYLNGFQVRSWATTGSIVYDTNNTLLAIGNDWNGTGYDTGATVGIQGRLSTVKIYNRALTAAEIQQNYNATRGRYEKGGINNPFSSPTEARVLGYTSGDYYFQSGSMSSPQLLEFQRDYYENRGWVCVFRSPYRSTATTNKIDLNIPMGGLLVQRDTLDLRGAVYWSTPITYTTVGGSGNNTADSGTGYAGSNVRRVILGNSGGHGIYNTGQLQCNWGSAAGAIGAGWDGSTCGTFPNDLIWGTGNGSTATYDNRSGTWSHWITW